MQKVSFGLDEDNDEVSRDALNAAQDIDLQIEKKIKLRKRTRNQEHYAPLPLANLAAKKNMEERKLPTSGDVDLLKMAASERAKGINARLKANNSKAQEKAKEVIRGKGYGTVSTRTPVSAKEIAAQMANKLNSKLRYDGAETLAAKAAKASADNDGKAFVTEYEEALEINDFPQIVRFKCCSSAFLNSLIDQTDCRVKIRGRYYEEHEPEPQDETDDPKLFMEVIGHTEQKVEHARIEIIRTIKNELVRLQAKPLSSVGSKARYNVL